VAEAFDTLLLVLDESESVQQTLDRLLAGCVAALPMCDDASVTLLRDGAPRTAAATSDRAFAIDQWEYAHERGPCIDALRDGGEHYLADAGDSAAYEGFAAFVAPLGIVSVAGLPLAAGGAVVGALNVYAERPHAFGDEPSRDLLRFVAAQAATAAHNVRVYDASRTLATQLTAAMESRATIEQAKGILTAQRGCSPEDAFALLRAASQRENVKLRQVAERIVASVARSTR
jgi:GAF domain-containing protein